MIRNSGRLDSTNYAECPCVAYTAARQNICREHCSGTTVAEDCAQALSEEQQMREYRAQLDADRAKKLSKGTNHADLRGAVEEAKSKVRAVQHTRRLMKAAVTEYQATNFCQCMRLIQTWDKFLSTGVCS